MPQQYPFSAVVGSDDMALALILTTISPDVGGVLVRGEKGTAKSTIVRAPRRRAAADRRGRRRPVLHRPARPGAALARRPVRRRRRRPRPGRCGWSSCRSAPPRTGCSARCTSSGAVGGQGGVRARPAGPRPPRDPLRRRGQPAARPPRRPAARRRRDGPLDRRARRRLGRARRPVRAGRHDEPRGGRAPAAAARPVRAHRRGRRAARPGRCGSRWSAAGWPTTPTRTRFAAPYADAERDADRPHPGRPEAGRPTVELARRGAAQDRRGVRGLRGRRHARRHRHRPRRRRPRRLARPRPT